MDVDIFSDQTKCLEQFQENLKINVKLVDSKKQIINLTHFGAPKNISYGTGRTG